MHRCVVDSFRKGYLFTATKPFCLHHLATHPGDTGRLHVGSPDIDSYSNIISIRVFMHVIQRIILLCINYHFPKLMKLKVVLFDFVLYQCVPNIM